MATDNNIKDFSAADIEKYHQGLLSSKERHDLEKAALDDPFLADALEGYAVAGVQVETDMKDLKERLAGRVEDGKVIAMKGAGKSSFPWLRVAALIILMTGAGLVAKQFIFTGKTKEIAQAEPKKPEEIRPGGNATTGTISQVLDSTGEKSTGFAGPSKQNELTFTVTSKDSVVGIFNLKDADGNGLANTEGATVSGKIAQPAAPVTIGAEDEKNNIYKVPAETLDKKVFAADAIKRDSGSSPFAGKEIATEEASFKSYSAQKNKHVVPARKLTAESGFRAPVNVFRGLITDSNNVGLPFARVYNPADNFAGTYTDAKGYFNITYPDTVLNVQVKSLGFGFANVQLRNNTRNNHIMLPEDLKNLSEVVINSQKPNATIRRADNNVKLEEPEPADGWDNYDTYIANNLNPPDEIRTKQDATGQVEISFEVDKSGSPVNIKIEKSLCSKCDAEAIRLIKEGPKWKQKARKKRTVVKVPFQ